MPPNAEPMLPNAHPEFADVLAEVRRIDLQTRRLVNGATLEATRWVREAHPFFDAFQTVDIPYAEERQAFRRLIGDQGPQGYLSQLLARADQYAGFNLLLGFSQANESLVKSMSNSTKNSW